MPTLDSYDSYDYAYIRVVPHVECGEFVNVGMILFCRAQRFLAARIALDVEKLLSIDPGLDIAALQAHLDVIPRICAGDGPIGQLGQAESFHWLVAPHSTMIQTSDVHSGLCTEPEAALERLMETIARKGKV